MRIKFMQTARSKKLIFDTNPLQQTVGYGDCDRYGAFKFKQVYLPTENLR
jgi:hypothetical protein